MSYLRYCRLKVCLINYIVFNINVSHSHFSMKFHPAELDESMLEALGILPQRKQHKKLLLVWHRRNYLFSSFTLCFVFCFFPPKVCGTYILFLLNKCYIFICCYFIIYLFLVGLVCGCVCVWGAGEWVVTRKKLTQVVSFQFQFHISFKGVGGILYHDAKLILLS